MACFLVPAAAATATTVLQRKIPQRLHPEWLNSLLWGGVAMLAVEHIAHQEVVPYPPFLTAMKNPGDIPVMLKEMVTVGGTMTLAIFALWLIMVWIASRTVSTTKTGARRWTG